MGRIANDKWKQRQVWKVSHVTSRLPRLNKVPSSSHVPISVWGATEVVPGVTPQLSEIAVRTS